MPQLARLRYNFLKSKFSFLWENLVGRCDNKELLQDQHDGSSIRASSQLLFRIYSTWPDSSIPLTVTRLSESIPPIATERGLFTSTDRPDKS